MTKQFRLSFSYSIFILLFSLNTESFSQSCNCDFFYTLKTEQKTVEKFDEKTALAKLQNSSSKGCQAKYYEWIAEELASKREYDSAEIYLQKAIAVYQKNSCDSAVYMNNYKEKAAISNIKGDYPNSLNYSFKMLPLTESSGNKYEEANCMLMIANSFNRMKESGKGIQYTRKAVGLVNSITALHEKADLLHKIAARFLWFYQDTKTVSVLDSAERFTLQLLHICRQINKKDLLRKGYNQMNGYAHERGDYRKALLYIDSSLLSYKDSDNISGKATNYGDKADVLMEMGNYSEARRFADSCLLLHQLVKNPELIANAYALIYQVSQRSENYKDALWAMNNYIEINDSLTNIEKSKTLNELEKKYNQAKNEKTIKELAQQKRIYVLLALACLLALVALAFFIRQQTLKNKQKILETEQRLNRARMNPHFFFNALSSLQTFALQGSDGKSMASNLSKFSHIMRETLESTYKEYVTIEQETDFLNEYLELQKMRFPQKFTYVIKSANEIEPDEMLIPAMILQPFVENSIEHGFTGIDYAGHIALHFENKENNLQITITDNGKGLVTPARENNEHISRASQIIKDRIYLLNIKLKTNASFNIENNKKEKGVTVFIRLPLLYKGYVKK